MSALDLTQQQNLRLSQRLSPKQLRLGRMLEMSVPEFEEEVQRVLDENPALEAVDSPAEQSVDSHDDEIDTDSEDILPLAASAHSYQRITPDDSAPASASLASQLSDFDFSPSQIEIARYIIGNLDSNGYLTRRPDQIADDIALGAGLDVAETDVKTVLEAIRSLDPPGIAATDLRDCLLLQLNRRKPTPEVLMATSIVRDHFNDLALHHFDRIRSEIGADSSPFEAARRIIASLNPKPGAALGPASDAAMRITPDFSVEPSPDGSVTVSLGGHVPELAIEETFMPDSPVALAARTPDAKAFIRSRREQASDFIELARMRRQTLLAVAHAIVHLQPEYFTDFDPARLRPMVLRDIAALTGLDTSVISRATSTKYMMTPRGAVLLRSLFSEGVGSDSAVASSHAVDEALRQIIDSEDKSAPLSDDAICKALHDRGFDVARRTVSKYRERLKIPVARLRRN